MFIDEKKFYGSATVGEKGQIVLPADLRRELNVQPGDKLAVMVLKKAGLSGIVLVKADIFTSIIEDFFGGRLMEFMRDPSSTDKNE